MCSVKQCKEFENDDQDTESVEEMDEMKKEGKRRGLSRRRARA